MQTTNFYKILQVDPEAQVEVIQSAYRRLSRMYHPDGATPDAEKMKLLNRAYETLRDPHKRAAYDASLMILMGEMPAAPGSASHPKRAWSSTGAESTQDYRAHTRTGHRPSDAQPNNSGRGRSTTSTPKETIRKQDWMNPFVLFFIGGTLLFIAVTVVALLAL